MIIFKMDFIMKIKKRVRLRREGFAGQHLVALPRDVVEAYARHPLLRGLRVTDAGLFPRARGHRVERPQGSVTALVILCTSGHGWSRLGSSPSHPVAPNDLLWLPARKPHSYGASPERPWTIVWAHIEGDEVDFWRHHLGLPATGGVLSLAPEKSSHFARALEETYHSLGNGYAFPRQVEAAAWIRNAFVSAARSHAPSSKGVPAAQRVAATVDWMRDHLYCSARLPELAMRARMSIPHYSALFRQITGYAPVNYHLRLRILRACHFLDTTDLPISEIAREVGFEDPYYFSRIFRRIMGRAPRNYRHQQKG